MPRKGAPIKDFKDLSKARIRRRRRRILAGLAEASGLFILMGLFPPLQAMLIPGLVLLGLLLAYMILLSRVTVAENAHAKARAAQRARAAQEETPAPAPAPAAAAVPAGQLPDEAPLLIEDDCHVIVRRSDEVDLEELQAAAAR
jgi:hypothetical protein